MLHLPTTHFQMTAWEFALPHVVTDLLENLPPIPFHTPVIPRKPSKIRFTVWPSKCLHWGWWPGLELRLLQEGWKSCQSLKLSQLKKCHLTNRSPKPPGEHPGSPPGEHSSSQEIWRSCSISNKAFFFFFLPKRTFGSLTSLTKPFYTSSSSGTDAVGACIAV